MGHIHIKNFKQIKPASLTGTFFRSVSIKHSDNILNTDGSLEYGGRYNPMQEFGALYMSSSKEICKKEITRKQKENLLAPQTIGKIKVSLTKIIDLTKAGTLKKLGIKKEDLIQDKDKNGWELPREIARAAYLAGYEAILAPSIIPKGRNLIIFDKYLPATKLTILSKTQE